jgi:hypothetical protein
MTGQSEVLTRHDLKAKIEGAASRQIVLPAKTANAAELSEADMERVAGGTAETAVWVITISVNIAAVVASAAGSIIGADKLGW